MKLLDTNEAGATLLTFVIIIVAAGIIAIVAFAIYRAMHPKLKQDEADQKDEKEYAAEELDRILAPVEDEEAAKQISEYKEQDE